MSAQYESMVKCLQHVFAARNGLSAAKTAKGWHKGIERVYEREYGGFFSCFGQGCGKNPLYLEADIAKDLGKFWHTEEINVEPYTATRGTHGTIDCIVALQKKYPVKMEN